jgi:hypothetical protein
MAMAGLGKRQLRSVDEEYGSDGMLAPKKTRAQTMPPSMLSSLANITSEAVGADTGNGHANTSGTDGAGMEDGGCGMRSRWCG